MTRWRHDGVLITGGTGSLGRALVPALLAAGVPRLAIYSRGEHAQVAMQGDLENDPRLRFFIGDVRDRERLRRAMAGVDVLIHAAALKHVTTCEYNPREAVLTNVVGAQNIVDAAIDAGVRCVLIVSTDKAVQPENFYGATKMCAEKIFVQGNAYAGDGPTRLAAVRYGNVVGSRGSVVEVWRKQRASGRISITDPSATRFWISLEQAAGFVLSCADRMQGGEVFVPKLPATTVADLARAVAPDCVWDLSGLRAGEKLHEILISANETGAVWDLGDRYAILTPFATWAAWKNPPWEGAIRCSPGLRIASDIADRVPEEVLEAWGRA